MPIELPDPTIEVLNRKREMDTLSPYPSMDEKEEKERQDAARAYAGENEKHFVDYGMDCIKKSVKEQSVIRKVQKDCWEVYNEKEPVSYADKEDWQARIIVPKPFETVQYGAAAVRKAFSPKFLSIKNTKNKDAADFWQKVMDFQLNEQHANFILNFTDATVMGLAVGISQEMIPRWVPGKGLEYSLIEPWKIQRDSDALSRDSQSGMYWIHQEWLDYFVLKKGEKAGRYFDVARVKQMESDNPDDNVFSTKEAINARKDMTWERSRFRKLILTSEFWGIVLDPKGNLLLPSATYTFAGGRVIQVPKAVSYPSLRWPGISFSPLPNILRHGGRGLLEGIMTIWEAMNNIMCLHQDYMQWIVNPPKEINVDALVDPDDAETWPGKDVLTKATGQGQQAIRIEQRRSRTSDVLANAQHYDQLYQRGSFVTDAVQGLPGYRKDITYRESAMNLNQAMGVFGLMGDNTEGGAIAAVSAGQEIVEAHAGYRDYAEIFTKEELAEYGVSPNPAAKNGVSGVPRFDGTFHISGIQALLKENETLVNIKSVIIPLSERPRYAPYIKPYAVLKAIETRVNLEDENIIATEDEAKIIDLQMQLAQGKQTDAMERLQELQEALGIAELAEKIDTIEKDGAVKTIEDKGRAVKAISKPKEVQG